MSRERIEDLSAKYREAFSAAEKALKRFERIDGNTLMPAINQLRYAASHYVDYENAIDDETKCTCLEKAIAHCQRGEYDAVEGAVIILGKFILGFNRKYSVASIVAIIPEYPAYFAKAKKSLSVLREIGAVRDFEVSESDLAAVKTSLENLVAFWDDVSSREPLVEQVEIERRTSAKRETRRFVLGTIIAIIAGIATIVGVAITLIKGVI